MDELPILAFEEEIVSTVHDNSVTVIVAETGAGKSTRVPLMLLNAGFGQWGMIGVTEPRRVAAMSLAQYDAELHGTPLGEVIGYQIRGERELSRSTQIKFMTEGILLRELHSDPQLGRYEVLIVDEAHERGVNQDLILALLKHLLRARPDIKVVIMSATIDEERFSKHFDNAPIIKVPGRVFQVQIRYAEETPFGRAMLDACVDKVLEIILSGEKGDILAFLPEEKMIREVCEKLGREETGCRILPLYGNQAPDEQRRVFVRNGQRRIIVATNIAETSITIDGVVHVVDSGLIKAIQYVSASMSSLQVVEHSKAGCDQRAGRAGRTQAGICHRLYTEEDYHSRPAYTEPEIRRMSLDQVLLHLRVLGWSLAEIKALEFIDPPEAGRWDEAAERLKLLGALDKDLNVSEDGQSMERLPLAPMLGRMLLNAARFDCLAGVATVAAAMTARPVFVRPQGKEDEAAQSHARFRVSGSDALTALNVWQAWDKADQDGDGNSWARSNHLSSRALRQIDRNRVQILDILEAQSYPINSNPADPELVRKAVASGLIINLCIKEGRFNYRWQSHWGIFIHPGSVLFHFGPQMMVCAEVVETTKAFARNCTAVEREWLKELIPLDACQVEWSFDDFSHDRIVRRASWQGLVISEEEVTELPAEALPSLAERLLDESTRSYCYQRLHPQTDQNREVVARLKEALGIFPFSGLGEEFRQKLLAWLVERLEGVRSLNELRSRDIGLKPENWLSPEQLAEHQSRMEEERQRREAEGVSRKEEERRRREAEEQARAAREVKAAPLRAQVQELRERAQRLHGLEAGTLVHGLIGIESQLDWSWTDLDEAERRIASLSTQVVHEERKQADRIALTEQIWTAVLAQYPRCPLCGGEWDQRLLCCNGEHDRDRIISLEEGDMPCVLVIASFGTDKDEQVASLRFYSGELMLRFALGLRRGQSWPGKQFKEITVRTLAVVLPEELVDQKDQIMADLAELRRTRLALEAQIRRVREAEAKVGAGRMKRLTFHVRDGQAVAEAEGVRYKAAFQDPYPQEGETWFCRLGPDTGGVLAVTVYPEIQVDTTESDLEELAAVLRETYPGLPDELLF